MNAPVLIYIAISTFTLVMSVWAIAAAVVGDPEHTGRRFVTGCCTAGLLLVTPCVGLAATIGEPRLIWGSALLPLLILGVTWSNVTTLRGTSMMTKLVAAPIAIYNLLLMAIYVAWCVTECFGVDLGTWSAALLAGFAQMQTLIGHPSASENPMWLYLPVVLPVWTALRLPEFVSVTASSIVATFLVFALVLVMPLSFKRTESYRNVTPPATTLPKALGVKAPWGDHVLTETQRNRIRIRLQQLGVSIVTFEVSGGSFSNERLRLQLIDEIKWARGLDIDTIAITVPPKRYASTPARSLDDLCAEMARAQTAAASDLRPDYLVLFSGPFGRLRRLVSSSCAAHDWYRKIRDSAHMIRAVNKNTKLAVSFDRFDAECEGLFRLLEVGTSPIDAIGIAVLPRGRLLPEILTDLARFESWCNNSSGTRPVLITECRFPIQLLGGERAHSNLVSHLLAFAGQIPVITSVSLDSLYDPDRNIGLISWSGRRRAAYLVLEQAKPTRGARPGR